MSNTVNTYCGNLVAEPYFKRIGKDNAVARLRIACSDSRKTDDTVEGKPVWQDYNNLYLDVECWGQLAINAAASLCKGFPVVVVGKLVTDTWETQPDGSEETVTRSRLKVKAHAVAFDLARFQVNSVRTSNAGNTLEGHTPAQPMDADALDRKLNGEGTQGMEERHLSAEDVISPSFAGAPGGDASGVPGGEASSADALVGAAAGDGPAPF